MAYVFSKINDALGNEQKVKQNIFDPNQGAPQQGGEQVPGAQTKTSTEGSLSGGQGGSGPGAEAMPTDMKAADPNLVRKNLGKTQAPKFAQQAQGELGAAETNLQNEANNYVKNYANKDYSIGNDVVDKAIGGDQDAYSKVRGRLGETSQRVEQFKPETDYILEDLENFKTDAGLQNILRRESGPQYSQGEAAFDSMLLGRNKDFQNIKSQLFTKQDALKRQGDEWSGGEGAKTKEAQTAQDANLAKAQTGIRDYVGSRDAELLKAQQDEMAAENAALAELRAGGGGQFLQDNSKAVLQKLIDDYAGWNPHGVAGYLDKSGVNAKDYYKVRDDYGDIADFINKDEALKFKNINSLLGRNDQEYLKREFAGNGPGARESFLEEEYENAVESGADKANRAADEAAFQELDKILAAASGRVGSELDAYRASQKQAIDDDLRSEYGDVWDQVSVDADPYNLEGKYSYENVLSADEAAQLNRLNAELEHGENAYGAGTGFENSFDREGYREALQKALSNSRLKTTVPNIQQDAKEASKKISPEAINANSLADLFTKLGSRWSDLDKHHTGNTVFNPLNTAKTDAKKEKSTLESVVAKATPNVIEDKAKKDIQNIYKNKAPKVKTPKKFG